MEALFDRLEQIREKLEQIHGITQNQMTILLDTQYMGEGLDMLEEMASFKETLTVEIEQDENIFQKLYSQYSKSISESSDKKKLKGLVDSIMKLKQDIIDSEQRNMLVMQDLMRRAAEVVKIPKNLKEAVHAYKIYTKS